MLDEEMFDTAPKVIRKKLNKLPANPEAGQKMGAVKMGRFPSWLHRKMPKGGELQRTSQLIDSKTLSTVCEEAKCPNRLECYSKKTATFLALGSACTRACGFCDIDFTKEPPKPDPQEPQSVADSVVHLGLKHVVITMVARDDLEDGGAAHIVNIVNAVRAAKEDVTFELLTSDLEGKKTSLDTVLQTRPEIYNHNIETVRALTPRIRHKATYERTLEVLKYVKKSGKARFVKSGIMVGLGETEEQVKETLRDLKAAGCDVVTIGQYLQASRLKLPVRSFVTPDQFEAYKKYGLEIGLQEVYSGPFVRSSYNAGAILTKISERVDEQRS